MSISVSRHASPRVLKITCVVFAGILGQQLFAQQPVTMPAHAKSAPALTISGNVSPSHGTPAKTDAAAQMKAEL